MAKVNLCNVVVKDNPCQFRNSFQFEITFECLEDLNDGMMLSNSIIYYTVLYNGTGTLLYRLQLPYAILYTIVASCIVYAISCLFCAILLLCCF